ncbi:MAG: winged helix-turn-helix transcriptional regulator [Chloroflexi bacterium]|nr:winged helix-turn-helix transcriptional regulator [Chloroflexota bacterium]
MKPLREPVPGSPNQPGPAETPNGPEYGENHVLRIGALQVDLWHVEARLEGERLSLTPLEFDLLAYLARNADRAVRPDELLREVWRCPAEGGGTKDQLKSAIKRLRRKIEPDPGQPQYLLTMRGFGYRITTPAE